MRRSISAVGLGLVLAQVSFTTLASAQASPPEVVSTGTGHKTLKITDPTYRQLFDKTRGTAAGQALSKLTGPKAPATSQVIQLTTLRGVQEVALPAWLQLEILEESGYTSWDAVPAAALDARGGRPHAPGLRAAGHQHAAEEAAPRSRVRRPQSRSQDRTRAGAALNRY